jgi:hypothetical protein
MELEFHMFGVAKILVKYIVQLSKTKKIKNDFFLHIMSKQQSNCFGSKGILGIN